MSVLPYLIFAFTVALLITVIAGAALSWRGPWGSFWSLFLIVFLVSWSGSVWVTPQAPLGWRTAWIPPLAIGTAFALLLGFLNPPTRFARGHTQREHGNAVPLDQKQVSTEFAVGLLYLVLVGFLFVAVIWGYHTLRLIESAR